MLKLHTSFQSLFSGIPACVSVESSLGKARGDVDRFTNFALKLVKILGLTCFQLFALLVSLIGVAGSLVLSRGSLAGPGFFFCMTFALAALVLLLPLP